MKKLTYLETLEAERQEKIKAKKQALLQEDQRQKRLWYLPMIGKTIVLVAVLFWMYLLVYAVWFVTGEAMKECPTVECPIYNAVSNECLPATGAN